MESLETRRRGELLDREIFHALQETQVLTAQYPPADRQPHPAARLSGLQTAGAGGNPACRAYPDARGNNIPRGSSLGAKSAERRRLDTYRMEDQSAAAPAGSTAPTAANAGPSTSTARSPVSARSATSPSRIPSTPNCANHPYRRSSRDPIPIGPVYVHGDNDVREFWQPSPDTEEIRQRLLDIVRASEEHTDGYPFYSPPPHARAIEQLVDFGDQRRVEALEDLVEPDEV